MALKSYLIDPQLVGMYMSPKHEVTKDGYTTMYRLIEGDSELDIKKQKMSVTTRTLYIGQRVFSTEDETVQRFIESKPYFGTKITVYDPVERNKEKLEAEKNSINLLTQVTNFDRAKIIEVGYALFGRQALVYLSADDISGLHSKIIKEAANDFERVDDLINNKDNAMRLFAGFLVASGIFEITIDDRYVQWADNKSVIYTVPNGVSPIDGLLEFFQTKEGQEVKKEASMRLEARSTSVENQQYVSEKSKKIAKK